MNELIRFGMVPNEDSVQKIMTLCNRSSQAYGLMLTEEGVKRLLAERREVLRETGRVELGQGVLPLLAETFRNSPYLTSSDYEDSLSQLQELFHILKNECRDLVSDRELAEAMALIYNEAGHGSIEFLGEQDWQTIYRVAVSGSLEGTGLGIDREE